jgi:twitching motility protein PilT
MQTMDASLASLVRAQRISMATAESRSSQPAELRKLVHAENSPVGVPQPVAA